MIWRQKKDLLDLVNVDALSYPVGDQSKLSFLGAHLWIPQRSLIHLLCLTRCYLPHISSCLGNEPHSLMLPEPLCLYSVYSEFTSLIPFHDLHLAHGEFTSNGEHADFALALTLCVASASLLYWVYFPSISGSSPVLPPNPGTNITLFDWSPYRPSC